MGLKRLDCCGELTASGDGWEGARAQAVGGLRVLEAPAHCSTAVREFAVFCVAGTLASAAA